MSEEKLPRVTEILKAVGLIDATWFTQYDLERGQAVHEACALLARGELDWDTVDPAIYGRVKAWERFLDDVRPTVRGIELEVIPEDRAYVGHVDYSVEINLRDYFLDLKGPSRAPWHGLQLAAYALAAKHQPRRANIYLFNDCNYRVKMRDSDLDFALWRKALRDYQEGRVIGEEHIRRRVL